MKNFDFKTRLSWGNWQLTPELTDPNNMAKHIKGVFDLGIFVLDTADIYGGYGNEEILGKALQQVKLPRSNYQIVTKGNIFTGNHPGYPDIKEMHYNSGYHYIKAEIERSLEKLQTPYIDLYLLHRLDYLLDPVEVASILTEYYYKGFIKAVGVSNFNPSTIRMLQKYLPIPLSTNQIEFSLKHLEPLDDGSLDLAMEMGYSPMFWSPYARGEVFKEGSIKTVLNKYATMYHTSAEAIATAWLLKHPVQGHIVIGSNNLNRIKSITEGLRIDLQHHEWYDILKATGKILP